MKFKSAIVTASSGSIGGVTFAHNSGGMYMRARSTPTNPNSPYQQTVRNLMASLANLWINTLTGAQRDAWAAYASNVSLVGKLGDPLYVSGMNMYQRSNIPRLQSGLPRVDNGPTTYDLGGFTNPSFSVDATADEVDVVFTATDDWANEDDAAMIILASLPQNPTVNFFKGPYRYAGNIAGNATTPPTSPAAIALPFSATAGQRVFVKALVSRADGRLSSNFRDFGLAA